MHNISNLFYFGTTLYIFDFMFQINAPFLYYIYHIPLHVSSTIVLIIRRIHCYTYSIWFFVCHSY